MRILLSSALDTMSGYGHDGCGLAMALDDAGHDVHLLPKWTTPPLPHPVAMMLTKPPPMPAPDIFDLGIVHLPPMDLAATNIRPMCQRLIASTMYEWEEFRWAGWEQLIDDLTATRYDLMVVPDQVSRQALSDPLVNPGVGIIMVPGGYDPDFWAEADRRRRDWTGTFRYVMVGRLDRRKGVWDAVRAFGALKDEHGDAFDAELILKTTLPHIVPDAVGERWKGITIHLEWWPGGRLREFYLDAHCYLAPSTGEGKNLPALEAATTGLPVIATDYGGMAEWISPEWAYPLSYELKDYPEGRAAQPRIEHLKTLMWEVYTDRQMAKSKGDLAARTLPAMVGWDSVVTKIVTAAQRLEPGGSPTGGAVAGQGAVPVPDAGAAPVF